jgi:integrase
MPNPERYTAKSGKVTWKVRLRDPARNKYTSETFPTKADAERFCNIVRVLGVTEALERQSSEHAKPQDGTTVDELFGGFIEWKARDVRSDRTISDYRRDYRNWVQPTFGKRPAVTITEDAVQEWVEEMRDKLSPKSIADRHSLLHGVYSWASTVRSEKVPHNPCKRTRLPKRPKRQPKGLRPAEWQALHIALRQIDPDAADLAAFLAFTGWRFSEAIALSTFDVEDYPNGVYVSMSRVVRRNAAGQHAIVEDEAKSEAGKRRMKLSPQMAAIMRRRVDAAPLGGLVFTTASGAQVHYSNFMIRAWNKAVKAANLGRRPTPHWLRHSHVFWLDLTGEATLPQIQKRIGHEHIETTVGVYGSMISDVSDAALAALDRLIAVPERLALPGVEVVGTDHPR